MLAEALAVVAFLFAGIFVPLAVLPGWLATLGRVFPITHSVAYLRAVLVDGRSLFTMWGDGGLVWAATTALAWLLAGITAFSAGQRSQTPGQPRPALTLTKGARPSADAIRCFLGENYRDPVLRSRARSPGSSDPTAPARPPPCACCSA
jgi:hypothetical protein